MYKFIIPVTQLKRLWKFFQSHWGLDYAYAQQEFHHSTGVFSDILIFCGSPTSNLTGRSPLGPTLSKADTTQNRHYSMCRHNTVYDD